MKMKTLWIPLVAGLLCLGAHADPTLYWGSDTAFGSGTGVVYTNGVLVPIGTHWLVELINTADDSVLYSTTDGFTAANGTFFVLSEATAWNGMVVKTVIYDAATRELAGLKAQFSGGPFLLNWSTSPTPGIFNYNAGYVTAARGSAPGQWQAIPEPAVATLLGIFGVGMLMGRRIFSEH